MAIDKEVSVWQRSYDNMAIRIGVGGEFFDRLREDDCYYVEITELIYELVNSGNAVTLFTRKFYLTPLTFC